MYICVCVWVRVFFLNALDCPALCQYTRGCKHFMWASAMACTGVPCHRPKACWMPSAERSFSRARSRSQAMAIQTWPVTSCCSHPKISKWLMFQCFAIISMYVGPLTAYSFDHSPASTTAQMRRRRERCCASLSDDVIS